MSSRLVDRALRPLFPDGFLHETQIIAYVISADDQYNADVLAGAGASAALMLAGAPFDGPIAEVRVARVDGAFVVNPTIEETAESDMDLVVAGKEDAIVMVEGEMQEVGEEDLLEALDVAHEAIRKLCAAQHELVAEAGEVEPFQPDLIALPDGSWRKSPMRWATGSRNISISRMRRAPSTGDYGKSGMRWWPNSLEKTVRRPRRRGIPEGS